MRPITTLLSLLSLFASTFAWSGGVGVGNAMRAYKATTGFSVSFSERLDLEVRPDGSFEINNASLVRSPGEVSKIEFIVTKGSVESFDQLLSYAQKENPGMTFSAVSFIGARGYFHEDKAQDRLAGLYYLFTGNYELVTIRIHALAAGNGLKWIAPIVRTFSYDETGPEVLGFQVNGSWLAGRVEQFFVRAKDEGSGIGLTEGDIAMELYPKSGPGKMVVVYGKINPIGNDWYSVEVRLGKLQPPGRFKLAHYFVADKAGNANLNWEDNGYFGKIPTVEVEIVNDGAYDVDSPLIQKFAVGPAWEAGKPATLYFQADDPSGIPASNIPSGGDCWINFSEVAKEGESYEGFPVCGDVRSAPEKGAGWYAIELKLNRFLPEGNYTLNGFGITDTLYNYVSLNRNWREDFLSDPNNPKQPKVKGLTIHIKNRGQSDRKAPQFLKLRVDGPWVAGSTAQLFLKAKDDLSGIGTLFKDCLRFDWLMNEFPKYSAFSACNVSVTPIGDDWYSVWIPVPETLRGGTLFLESMYINDKAGHKNALWFDSRHPDKYDRTDIPRLDVEVVR